jgi:small subunit ribosomal protein S17
MQKTIVVQVERVARHPLYGKVVKSHKKYKVHDENNDANIGDTVQIRECRPMSKDKQFYLEKILTRAEIV